MGQRFNVAKEVVHALDGEAERALQILPALAGEIMAGGDEVMLTELREAMAQHVLHQRPNHEIANAVLAMVRTYSLHQKAHVISSP